MNPGSPGTRAGLAAGLVALAGVVALAVFPADATITIERWTVDGGGTSFTQNGAIILAGTIGQPDAALLQRPGLTLVGGFWKPTAPMPVGVGDGPFPGEEPGPETAPALSLRIHPPVPNPLVARTRIAFDLPEERDADVRIFDVSGALVAVLSSGRLPAGRHRIDWNAHDADGRRVAPGLYMIRIRLGQAERSQKIVVLR